MAFVMLIVIGIIVIIVLHIFHIPKKSIIPTVSLSGSCWLVNTVPFPLLLGQIMARASISVCVWACTDARRGRGWGFCLLMSHYRSCMHAATCGLVAQQALLVVGVIEPLADPNTNSWAPLVVEVKEWTLLDLQCSPSATCCEHVPQALHAFALSFVKTGMGLAGSTAPACQCVGQHWAPRRWSDTFM